MLGEREIEDIVQHQLMVWHLKESLILWEPRLAPWNMTKQLIEYHEQIVKLRPEITREVRRRASERKREYNEKQRAAQPWRY